MDGDVATGFSHTPEGAVVAMMQQQARLAWIDDADWPVASRSMAVVAPADQPPVRRVATGFDSRTLLPVCAGFRWQSYSGDRAEADLELQNRDGTVAALHAVEVWTGADWRAELPATGGTLVPLHETDGYQQWPGLPR